MIPFAENYTTAQLMYSDNKQTRGACIWGLGGDRLQKGKHEIWEAMKNALCPDMCQKKTWDDLLNIGFIICKLYPNALKINFKKCG